MSNETICTYVHVDKNNGVKVCTLFFCTEKYKSIKKNVYNPAKKMNLFLGLKFN